MTTDTRLRVALLAGGLTQGGAEKQLTYMAQALLAAGVDVRVFSLTQGEYYQSILEQSGVPFTWVGQANNPALRILTLLRAFRDFRPHIVQSTHFFANLYAALVGRAYGSISIGSVRSNGFREVKANGHWSPYLLRLPHALLINSEAARQNIIRMGRPAQHLFVLPNVIDLEAFDRQANPAQSQTGKPAITAITVARLIPVKRLERFLAALAQAREQVGDHLTGVIVGDGPERVPLEQAAQALNLLPNGLRFLGLRSDIPALLSAADVFMLTSDNEGFPNAILEGMAARLPVITTPAGDAARIVQPDVTGYVVPFDNTAQMAQHLCDLATQPNLREKLGRAGRTSVEQSYSFHSLSGQLLRLYRQIAELQRNAPALIALSNES